MIRPAQIQDISQILQVIHNSIRSCIQDHQRHEPSIQQLLESKTQHSLLMSMHYNDSWVYTIQERVVGFIMISDQGEIIMNYVASEAQKQGIGAALMQNIIELIKPKKLAGITIHSTHTAKDFYLKQGFKVTAQSTATISMHKTLKHEKQPYPDPTFSVLN